LWDIETVEKQACGRLCQHKDQRTIHTRYSGKDEQHNEAQPLLQADELVLQPIQTDRKQRIQGSSVEQK